MSAESLGLGKIITIEQHRDAIHVAVAPVEAGESLAPGAHVKLTAVGKAVACPDIRAIGVVDPFLHDLVSEGERFWLFLKPGTITSLRHEWSHPDFSDAPKAPPRMGASVVRLQAIADQMRISYDGLMDGAAAYLAYDDYLIEGGRWEGVRLPDDFWNHYEIVTEVTVPSNKRNSFFSCSC